jgi:hypothetical protein
MLLAPFFSFVCFVSVHPAIWRVWEPCQAAQPVCEPYLPVEPVWLHCKACAGPSLWSAGVRFWVSGGQWCTRW